MVALLKQLHQRHSGAGLAVIVTHPFEFIKPGDFRYSRMTPNRLVQGRLRQLCQFLAEEDDKFEMVPLAEAAAGRSTDRTTGQPSAEGNPFRAFVRAGENFLNDRLP